MKLLKKIAGLAELFCLVAASINAQGAVFNLNVTADLSQPGIYLPDPQNNYTFITLPLAPPSAPYGSGDTLNLSVTFQDAQRLLLTAHPTGQSEPLGEQGIGVFVSDTTLSYSLDGQVAGSVSLIDPIGAYYVDSMSTPESFAGAQGAIARLVTYWTDTAFSVAGFDFQMQIQDISQPVLPNEIVLEFREFQVQPIPEPGMWSLMVVAAAVLLQSRLARGNDKVLPDTALEPTK